MISHFAFEIPFIPFQTGVLNQTSVMWPLAWKVEGHEMVLLCILPGASDYLWINQNCTSWECGSDDWRLKAMHKFIFLITEEK